jgi:hypothetical protein
MTLKHSLTIALSLFTLTTTQAQTDEEKNMAEAIKLTGGGTFFKPKIMPNLTSLALAQVTVDFKTVSTKAVTQVEKKQGLFGKAAGSAATASVTAYLETSDGEMEAADYQELTNHFYQYFQRRLKESGVDTVAWDKITATDLYKDGEKSNDENEEEKAKGNAWVTYSANSGNEMFNGKTGFAFGKAKKAGRMCDDVGTPIAFIHVALDFAELNAEVNIKSSAYKSVWTPNTTNTTSFNSSTSVSAFMRIASFPETLKFSMLMNEKMHAENVTLTEAINANSDYATEMVKDPSRAEKRSKFFRVSLSKKMESTPVVITTTKEKYKAAAKKGLENYVEVFIAKAKVLKKD